MTRVLAVANQKGGVGKTTTVVNLAAALAAAGRRVLVVDLDPQASATRWLGGSVDDDGSGEALTGGAPLAGLARPVLDGLLHLVPASLRLAAAERSVGLAPGSDERLRRSLAELPPGWGYVLLDCPPNLGLATLNALNAATDVVVPVEAQVLPLHGLVGMLRTLDGLPRRPGAASRPPRILACRFDARTRHAREVLAELRARFDGTLFRTVIRQNVRLAECPSFHLPVHLYAPRCRGDRDYRDLADEVLAAETTRDD